MRDENDKELADNSPPRVWWERLGGLEKENGIEHAQVDGRIVIIEKWATRQNGALARIEEGQSSLRDKFDDFKSSSSRWLVGVLTTLIVALVMLIVNIIIEPSKIEVAAYAAVQRSIPDIVNEAVDAAILRTENTQGR